MSTDREMLELAAKAAGYDVLLWSDKCAFKAAPHQPWNPRDDDGDSRRLEVKLNLTVSQFPFQDAHVQWESESGNGVCMEPHGADPCAATRLAVLRAAAEIGKSMP